MMDGRLPSGVVAAGLIKACEAQGGFGTVLHKGDATAGAILIVLTERGIHRQLVERILQPDGSYGWRESAAAQNEEEAAKFLQKRQRFDPDLWVLELDVASAERFTAELAAFD